MYYRKSGMFFLIVTLLFNAITLSSCESQQAKEARISKEKAEESKNQKEDLEQLYRRKAILLSLKYKVDEDKVFNIIMEENDILYKDIEDWDGFISGKNLYKRIEGYSVKYNIPTEVIASILIDYEVMQSKD